MFFFREMPCAARIDETNGEQKRPSLQMTCFVIWSVAGFIEDCATGVGKIPPQKCVLLCAAKKFTCLERVKGIEPSSEAWKAPALPFSYARKDLACCGLAALAFGRLDRSCARYAFGCPHGALRRRCEMIDRCRTRTGAPRLLPTKLIRQRLFYRLHYGVVLCCEVLSQASTSCKKVRTSDE